MICDAVMHESAVMNDMGFATSSGDGPGMTMIWAVSERSSQSFAAVAALIRPRANLAKKLSSSMFVLYVIEIPEPLRTRKARLILTSERC